MKKIDSKRFACMQIKREAQSQIRACVQGMSRDDEVSYFRRGAEEFAQRVESAKAMSRQETKSS